MKSTIPIFFATDDNYTPYLSVAINSIKDNASKNYHYNIHILHQGLNENNIQDLKSYEDECFTIYFDDVQDSLKKFASELFVRDYYSKATYYRIFIPSIFTEYDKILYLDCDITVKGDIAELYNTEIGDNYLGAITDEAVQNIPNFYEYVENFLGIKRQDYFNAGILVINLAKMREIHFEKRFMDILSKYKFVVAQDQDYLNVLCKGKVTYISKIWNKQPIQDNNLTINNIKLVHYNLSAKPWHYDDILYEDLFWKYAKKSNRIEDIMKHKHNFDDQAKATDYNNGSKLIELAGVLSKDANTFKHLVERGVINLDNLGQTHN